MNKKARRFAQLLLAMVFLITAMLGFPRTAAAANPPVPLSSLAPGTVVNFAGYNWIVLDPGTGYLLMQGFYGNNQPFTDMSDLSGIITPNIFDPNNHTILRIILISLALANSSAPGFISIYQTIIPNISH